MIGDRLERFTLPNGLRVVLAPSTAVPVVGIAVLYDVGIRSEPVGRTGFAHLFEHLMFQGSEKVPKLAHARYVQGAGGSFNGSTHLDYTVYHETLPSTALERGLFLEADRMRGPRITERNLRNQVDVVSEEINTSVKNRPYGGFPWLHLPPLLFDGFANTHDGYGSQVDLDSATVAEANAFFEQYYAPANAVLCVAGGIDVEETTALVARHFGTVPARPVPVRPSFAEPALTGSRRGAHRDPLAPLAAFATGWRVPDPIGEFRSYLAHQLLADLLAGGESSRLVQRLVQADGTLADVSAGLGLMGDSLAVRDPGAFVVSGFLSPGGAADKAVRVVDEEIERIAAEGLDDDEVLRLRTMAVSRLVRELDSVVGRAKLFGLFEQQRGDAALIAELPGLLSSLTGDEIAAAAATVGEAHRAVVEILPGAAR
ncbi:M16 family metallopeptidase [Amycolatopsis sp. CA-230715]|uniref:M16 family metallopeptidase n=1 Tax=Amycolatopsis sp. CA-230715 TaxID=2745196 RepID=UPI003FA4B9DC